MNAKKLKVEDRVKRVDAPGCQGTVKSVRQETIISSSNSEKERPTIVTVLWDNGTQSCFGPDALEIVK